MVEYELKNPKHKEFYLEDHPRTCKWLITMVSKSPKQGKVPLPNGLNGLSMGVTNHYIHWDDPPSRVCFPKSHVQKDYGTYRVYFSKISGVALAKREEESICEAFATESR